MNPREVAPLSPKSSGGKGVVVSVILVILLLCSLIFGAWAYSQMLDYKNNSDKKAAVAAAASANAAQKIQKTKDEEAAKSPYKVMASTPTYGSITFAYPKNWSAYVDTTNTSEPINGYFHPDVVPGTQSKTAFALREELVTADYAQVLQQYNSSIQHGQVTAKAYMPPRMQGVANAVPGTYFSGQINPQDKTQNGAMLVIRVRDKTLEIYTQSTQFISDFNNIILASLKFLP